MNQQKPCAYRIVGNNHMVCVRCPSEHPRTIRQSDKAIRVQREDYSRLMRQPSFNF